MGYSNLSNPFFKDFERASAPKNVLMNCYSDPIRIVKGFRRKSFSQSPFTIQAFTNQIGLL